MRVWDIHPGYLSRQSLLGQHAEIHAIYSILKGCREGYSKHPETMRWKNHLEVLAFRHELSVKEMKLRGFNHLSQIQVESDTGKNCGEILQYVDKPARQFELLREKYRRKGQYGRIPLPRNGWEFWNHYRYSIMGRGSRYYHEIMEFLRYREDFPIEKVDELILMVIHYMKKKPEEDSLREVIHQLWGYCKDVSSSGERSAFWNLEQNDPQAQLDCLYRLAQKYNLKSLLHSTVFADLIL